jgi:hypothetical protein
VLPPGNPVAQDDQATTASATPVVVTVLANDSDPNHFGLTVTSITAGPAHGTAQINGDNTITYTPTPTYSGVDQFSYAISNGHGGTASAKVTVSVVASPPPVAQNDSATTPFQKPVTIAVLANDSDPGGFPLSVTQTTAPSSGTVTINANNTITYTPALGFEGNATFNYTISNGHGGTTSAMVTVAVLPPPPPIAQNDNATTPNQTPVTIIVLANDSDPSGLPLSVTQVTGLTNGSGTLTVNPNNTITFTPDIEFDGTATFNYTIRNTYGGTATATVSVDILAPVPPIAGPDSATTPFNTPVTINVLANDSDPNSLPLSIQQAGFPLHGSAVTNANNTITYTPTAGFQGVDMFIYVLSNNTGAVTSGNVTVTVLGP